MRIEDLSDKDIVILLRDRCYTLSTMLDPDRHVILARPDAPLDTTSVRAVLARIDELLSVYDTVTGP